MADFSVIPFLKWAGDKRWLVSRCADLLPTNVDHYIEPFLGSGAVFFYLDPPTALLSDANQTLIETYRAVRNSWRKVSEALDEHHDNHSKDYYYRIRAAKLDLSAQRAAQFIYLNRTCWNALYRVNRKGEFNVPIGSKDSVVLATDNFAATSRRLRRVNIFAGDFEPSIEGARKRDFVFVDPPYAVKDQTNGFVKYNDKLFDWEDQVRLRDLVERAKKRGAYMRGKKPQRISAEQSEQLIFRNMFIDEKDYEITDIIWDYFSAVRDKWPIAWSNTGRGNILNRTNGFRAFMRFLRPAYLYFTSPGGGVTQDHFAQLLSAVEMVDDDFSVEEYPPGTSGETRLFINLSSSAPLVPSDGGRRPLIARAPSSIVVVTHP